MVPATFRWVNPAGGDFATAANWEDQAGNAGVPGATDDALILVPGITVTSVGTTTVRNLTSVATVDVTAGSLVAAAAKLTGPTNVSGGSLVLNGFSSVADLNLPSGTLTGAGPLNVTGSMVWTGGTVGVDLDIATAATLEIGGGGTDTLDGATLTNHGTTTWDGVGTLRLQNGAIVWNTGTFVDATNHAATSDGSTVFHNLGLYAKSGGAGVSDIGVVVDNRGTLRAEVGTLRLSGGTTQVSANNLVGGSWYVAGGATLDLPSQSVTDNQANITLDGLGATFTAISGLGQNDGTLTLSHGAGLATGQLLTNQGQLNIGAGSTLSVTFLESALHGRLNFEVGGSPVSGQYGRIVAPNGIDLVNTAIGLTFVPGANTVAGDVYPLISGNSITVIVDLPPATEDGAGVTPVFDVAVGATTVTATATQKSVTDLGVTSVTPPAGSVAPGDPVTIDWIVKNNAAVPTTATNWTDAVYISTSPTFDASAVLVAQVPHSVPVPGGGTYNGTYTGPIPGTVAGAYYVHIRADDGQVVPDADRPDNIRSSATTFTMIDPVTLTLGDAPVNGTVAANGDVWYRLDAPGGTPLRVTATFATAGAGEVSIDYRMYPQPGSALDLAADPTTLMQTVGVSATQGGTHYVRVHGTTGGTFTIHADTPALAITRLGNTAGSSAGSATLTVHGVGFTPNTTVSLVKGTTTRKATAVLFVSGEAVYVTFKLKGLAAGSYDVRVADGTQTITAVGGYTVNTTAAGQLVYHINPPAVTPPVGQSAIATIEVTNTGGTDIPVPLLSVFDSKGANIRLPEDPVPPPGSPPTGGVTFLPTSTDAPAGLIPAGYHGSIPVIVTPTVVGNSINLVLNQAQAGTPMFWDVLFKQQLRPKGTAADSWTADFSAFKSTVGATSTTYVAALRNAATYLASVGSPVRNANVLLGYLIRQSDASIPGNTLFQATDAAFPSPGLALDFARTFPTSVGGQQRFGRLGRGWVDYWDITVTSESGGLPPTNGANVFLHIAGTNREFTRSSNGINYHPVYGGEEDVLTFDGTRYVLTADDGTVTAFRADGQLDYLQDLGGTRVTAAYDGNNKLNTLTHSDGRALTFTSNAAGQLASVTDPGGRVTTFAYKGQQLVSATDALGVEKYTYSKNALASVTAPGGLQTAFTYDKLHRLTGRKVGKTAAIKYAYGVGGTVTSTDAAGGKVTLLTNADGLVAAVRGGTRPDLRITYDGDGLSTRIESSAGQVWTTTRDDDGHPTAVTDSLGNTVTRSFNGDHLAGVTDARGNTTGFQTDAAGNALAITYPGGATESFVYDPTGNMVETINRRGNAVQYLTNADGQVVRRLFADNSHTDYTYDAHGNMATATNAAGTTTLTYLPNDRLQKIAYPDGNFLQFTYDAAGRRATSVDKGGFTTGYMYDKAGRLTGLVDGAGAALVKYAYDKAGRLSLKTSANGTFTTYSYDAAGRLLSLVNHKDKKTVNSQFDYTYDAAGRAATMTTGGVTTTYGYDPIGQLISVATPTPTRTITYTYDAAGNRTSVTDNGVTTNYTVNNLNEVTAAGTTTYGYDAEGNRTSMTDISGITTYAWDDLNQLTGVTSPTDTFAYTRDGLDQLFTTTRNTQTTTNLNDPLGLGAVTAQYDASVLIAHYVNGVGLEARVAADESKAFYDFDRIGNVIGLTNAIGTYLNKYSYLPFGETTTITPGLANPFTFVGRWGVSADGNGLFNMRARSYDATAGGFVSDDPIGFAGGDVNIRRYAGNDPVNRIDPTGLKCDDDKLKKLENELVKATLDYIHAGGSFTEGMLGAQTPTTYASAEDLAFAYGLAASPISPWQVEAWELREKLETRERNKQKILKLTPEIANCKKELPKTASQPFVNFTTPEGKPHPPGGVNFKPVPLT